MVSGITIPFANNLALTKVNLIIQEFIEIGRSF